MNMIRRFIAFVVVAASVAVCSLPATYAQDESGEKTQKKGKEDKPLPAVPASLQGMEFVLPAKLNTKAKVYFIYKSRSACSICVAETPAIVEIYKKMKGKAAELVMLNIDVDRKTAEKWAKKEKMKFPIVAPDDWGPVPFPYSGGGFLPCMVAVDADGNKLGQANGGEVAEFLQNWKKMVREVDKAKKASAAKAKKKTKEPVEEESEED